MLDLEALNEAQRQAVTHGEGPLLVLAGPGSGKTFTITQRIFFLIQECGVPPENILVVTFTKEAALSMQRRFHEQSDYRTYPVNFGTFHSIFYRIICDSHSVNTHKLITENQKRSIIMPILRRQLPREETVDSHGDRGAEDAGLFLAAISFYKNTGKEDAARQKLSGEWSSYFSEVMQAYEKEKSKRRLLDFDDMVYRCRNLLLEDRQARIRWQNRFSHILMDEFQDINPMQYEVVKLLAGGKSELFAVGDDDQSIYGFRGSEPACLNRFAEEFGAKQLCLTVNYRSCPEIVEASCKVITENKMRFQKELKSASGRGEKQAVRLRAYEDREAEYAGLANLLREKVETAKGAGERQESLAVLFRTNAHMQGFAACLSKQSVPYRMKEKVTSIYEHFIVKDILAYLRLAAEGADREQLLRILNKPLRYLSREALGSGEEAKGHTLFQVMLDFYCGQREVPYRRERIQAIKRLERDLMYIQKLPLYLGVQYILKSIGYEMHLKENAGRSTERWREWTEICDWVKEEARQYETLEEWLEAKKCYERKLQEMSEEKAKKEKGNEVQLMTIHASKGLEFDRVWIPDCNEKIFPHGNGIEATDCEEERRIFYVAMTRAKKSLELLYLTGTRERPRFPSRFLNPLLPKK